MKTEKGGKDQLAKLICRTFNDYFSQLTEALEKYRFCN